MCSEYRVPVHAHTKTKHSKRVLQSVGNEDSWVGGWVNDPPFFWANSIHFLHKVFVKRAVQKEPFCKNTFRSTPLQWFLPMPLFCQWFLIILKWLTRYFPLFTIITMIPRPLEYWLKFENFSKDSLASHPNWTWQNLKLILYCMLLSHQVIESQHFAS